jgi:hypothetical protein
LTAVAPTVAWTWVAFVSMTNGGPGRIAPGDTVPPLSLQVGERLMAAVQATGSASGDPLPIGTLDVTVSPTTGVTVRDWGFDGSNPPEIEVGNGTAACNLDDEGYGCFGLDFADAGTFTVSVQFSSDDANYTSEAGVQTLTVSVS